ncbi:MAG: PKD domain-containing protein [Bacteroidetes bacterium]|nr:MAG: PKD domain-containing protein [Bacteroidota bacterium]
MKIFTKRGTAFILFLFIGLYSCRTIPNTSSQSELHNVVREKKRMRPDRPDLALLHDINRTKDPATGTVPYERRAIAMKYTRDKMREKAAITGVNWTERGPNNIAGRVKSLIFDPNDSANGYKKVWAGGADGGLWYNNDITDANSSWQKVSDFWSNLAVTSIVYDPNNTQTFYVGTGEGFFNVDAVRGDGFWKSTNGGATWTHFPTPSVGTTFYRINQMVVANDGSVLIADRDTGVIRSTNGGTTWNVVIANGDGNTEGVDLERAANGDLYCSTSLFTTSAIRKSTNHGATWTTLSYGTATGTPGRIELACAPNAANTLYAVAYNAATATDNDVSFIKRSTDGGSTWTTITRPGYITNTSTCAQSTTHYTRAQAWYSSVLKVHPTNSACLLAGGIDLFRSIDATDTPGNQVSWTPLSYWTGVTCGLPIVHADQHAIAFHPTDFNKVIFGNDGGVYYSTNAGNTSVAQPSIEARNKNFNITQFYAVATKNEQNSAFYIGGAQDNGSLIMNGFQAKPGREGTGGDGAFCFVDQDNANVVITSYVQNNYYQSTDGGLTFPTMALAGTGGDFINAATYDNQGNILYTNRASGSMYRVTSIGGTPASTAVTLSPALSGSATALKVSPNTANVLFIAGNSPDAANPPRLYKITGANTGATEAPSDISGTQLPNGATISSIDVGATDNQIMVTLSNYGVNSVWETTNGGTNWTNKDNATIPDMPIRWGLYNPNNRNQVLLATEAGVYSTDDFHVGSPTWGPTANALANVRCDMLQYRAIDKTVVVGTHGRGIFTTDIWADSYADFDYTRTSCNGVQFNDGSLRPNNSWAWDVNGDGITDYTTQNPTHTYTTPGTYSVRLTIANGTSSITKTNYISIVGTAPTASSCAIATNSNKSNTVGILNVSVGTINHTTPPDDGTYKDYACEQSTVLNTNTNYTMTIKVGDGINPMGCRAYIDYNNDGDFADTGEDIGSTTSSATITQTINFTTSTSPTKSTNLRMRVLCAFSLTPSTCSEVGLYGQAEDYSVIFADAITWTGNTNTDWHNTANWNPAVVPGRFNDVTLPTGRPNYPTIVTSTPVCKNLTINNGANLTIGNGGNIVAGGDLACAGTLTYGGTTAQTALPQAAVISGNLVINNPAGVKLVNAITVNGTLTISNGYLDMNGNDINLGTAGTLVETPSADRVVFDGLTGSLAEIIATGRVINASYTTVAGMAIQINRGSAGSLTVTVARRHRPETVATNIKSTKKLYKITTTAGSITAGSIRIYYAPSEANGLVTAEAKLWRYSSGVWANFGGTYNANGGNPYVEVTGTVNAFSDWTLGNTSTPMPITLLSFKGTRQDAETAKLVWVTGQEINNKGFEVERSIDAVNFDNIAFVEGLGTSTVGKTYTHLDKFAEGAYYRLKQMDISGRTSYSPVVYVEGSNAEVWNIYPNPTQGQVSLTIPRKALGQDNVKIRILNTSGQLMAEISNSPAKIAEILSETLSRMADGTYIIEGQTAIDRWQQKIVKK